MAPQCSWLDMEPATMHFCEELVCNSFLVQPANAISNVAFVIVGIYLLEIMKDQPKIFYIFPISAILVGITSFLYHASWTFFFQIFDVSSMFILSCLLLSFNIWRLGLISTKKLIPTNLILVIISSLLMILIKGKSGEFIFGVEVVSVLILEFILFKRNRDSIVYKYLNYSIFTFALAFFIWIMDVKEIWCLKENHIIQGHAVWHILNSFCFYFLYKFYLQFQGQVNVSSDH